MSTSASEPPAGAARARYYDGRTSAARDAWVALESAGARLRVWCGGDEWSVALAARDVGERVGSTNRLLTLPERASVEILDNSAFDAQLAAAGLSTREAPLRSLEAGPRIAAVAVAVVAVAVGWFLAYGAPALASRALRLIPPSADRLVGADGLKLLDKTTFTPSKLPPARQAELSALFAAIASSAGTPDGDYRIEFRGGGSIGANALALPAGTVVLTDELVALAHDDDELRGVLAHEVGHLARRHAMRHLVESSTTALLIGGVLGDVTGVSGLVASVPTVLVHSAYSRDLEREADEFAFAWMAAHRVDPRKLGALLERLAANDPGASTGLLASHPSFQERMRAAEQAPR